MEGQSHEHIHSRNDRVFLQQVNGMVGEQIESALYPPGSEANLLTLRDFKAKPQILDDF